MYSRSILFLIILFALLIVVKNSARAEDAELGVLKKQVQNMQKNMKILMERIEELEQKNAELEIKSEEKTALASPPTEPGDVATGKNGPFANPDSPGRQGTTFLDRAFQAFNPDISVLAVFAAAYYSDDDPVVLAENDPEDTGINLQELEVAFQSVVDPYFRFDSFLSFSTEGVEIEEAYGTSLISLPLNTQIRAGRIRSKFGRINTQHRHYQNFVTLPLVSAEFLGEHLNPTSIETNFLLPLPWFAELSASVGSPDVESATFDNDSDSNNLSRLLYVFHLGNFFELSETWSLSLGASYATGSNGTDDGNRTNLFGLDIYAKYRPLRNSNPCQTLSLQSEVMFRDAETVGGDIFDYGFYTQVVYRFMKRWSAGLRFALTDTDDPLTFDSPAAETIAFDGVNGQTANGSADDNEEVMLGLFGRQYRISGMLTFAPSEYSLIRFQYDYTGQTFDSNESAVFLQFQYLIGAHGAHPF